MSDAIALAIFWFSNFLRIALFARAIISWLPIRRDGFLPSFLAAITEPFVGPVRWILRKSPLGGGMIDLSLLVTLLLLMLFTNPLVNFVASLDF